MTYQQQLIEWLEQERENGLIDIRIIYLPKSGDISAESLSKEILAILSSLSIPLDSVSL